MGTALYFFKTPLIIQPFYKRSTTYGKENGGA